MLNEIRSIQVRGGRAFVLCLSVISAAAPICADDVPLAVNSRRPLEADEVARLEPKKLRELLVRSQDQIEITARLDGVMISDMRFNMATDQRTRTLQLAGRVRGYWVRPLQGNR